MWSLIDLYAFGFIGAACSLCCSSDKGSIFSLCTLISQPCSNGVLIICNLPDIPLSQCCINTCYTKLGKTTNTSKLEKRVSVS